MALSFAVDIRPLFRDSPDIDSMKDFGLDLSSYEDVRAKADVIYPRLADGSMPCDCGAGADGSGGESTLYETD